MKQPALGKKISELRLGKGLTQAELAGKCNLSLRTIQRIESAEVVPRSYTVKLIFSELNYPIYDSNEILSHKIGRLICTLKIGFGQILNYVIDLFNLKTKTMRKLATLTVVFAAVIIGLISFTGESNAQSAARVQKIIEKANKNFVKWFNSGDIESLSGLYRDDACLVARGCGKAFIKNYYQNQSGRYKFSELAVISLSVSDTIAVEKGRWKILFENGKTVEGEYLTEWHRTGKKWLMVNDISGTSEN